MTVNSPNTSPATKTQPTNLTPNQCTAAATKQQIVTKTNNSDKEYCRGNIDSQYEPCLDEVRCSERRVHKPAAGAMHLFTVIRQIQIGALRFAYAPYASSRWTASTSLSIANGLRM